MAGRVLVTGATGFVGSHVAEALLQAGYEVRCGARDPNHPRWLADIPAEVVPLDLEKMPDLSRALQGVDTVVHAAGITRARREEDYDRVNAAGTRRLADAAQKAGVRRFVQISSLAARGPDGMNYPASAYGWSKKKAEANLRSFSGEMETIILRPTAVYGPRDTDLLPLFKMARRGWLTVPSGPGLLQPVYVRDVAAAVLAAVRTTNPASGPLPIAEPVSYSWKQVVQTLETAVGREVRPVCIPAGAFVFGGRVAERSAKLAGRVPVFDRRRAEDLARHTWTCNVSETERALRWRAEVPLVEGTERTARWYKENGWM